MHSQAARILILLCGLPGCGPLIITTPLPEPANEEQHAAITESWSKAFTPADRLDHQQLLDVLIGTTAYQLAVDRFRFVSEKAFAGGRAVIEITVDRATPDADRFEITIFDETDQVVRRERYNREEVQQTLRELPLELPPKPTDREEAPEMAEIRAKHEARQALVQEFFPKEKEPEKPEVGEPTQ
ncbi:MAG TPA: hypothetical protein VM165_04110 [Planctomycetaceae bacterium]|nr:hypothetical protein [Planctomycetaceae bacterium]